MVINRAAFAVSGEDGKFKIDPVPSGKEIVFSDNRGLPGYLLRDILDNGVRKTDRTALGYSAVIALGGFLFGYDSGVINGTVEGDGEIKVNNVAKIEEAQPGHISFLANEKYEPQIYTTKASAVIVSKDFEPKKATFGLVLGSLLVEKDLTPLRTCFLSPIVQPQPNAIQLAPSPVPH